MKEHLLLLLVFLNSSMIADAYDCDNVCDSATITYDQGKTFKYESICGDLIRNGCTCDVCRNLDLNPFNGLECDRCYSTYIIKHKYIGLLNNGSIAAISDMPQFKSMEIAKNYDAMNNTELMNLSSRNVSFFKGGNTSLVLINNSFK